MAESDFSVHNLVQSNVHIVYGLARQILFSIGLQKVNTGHSLMLTNEEQVSDSASASLSSSIFTCAQNCVTTLLCYVTVKLSQKQCFVLNIIRLSHLVKEYMNVLWHLQVSNYSIIAKL